MSSLLSKSVDLTAIRFAVNDFARNIQIILGREIREDEKSIIARMYISRATVEQVAEFLKNQK